MATRNGFHSCGVEAGGASAFVVCHLRDFQFSAIPQIFGDAVHRRLKQKCS